MAELSEDEKQSLDDALKLDDLYEATLNHDGGFGSEQMAAIAKLIEEAMGCVLSVLDPEMYDAVQRDCPGKKLGREARAVRTLPLFDETPQKLAGLGAAFDTADLLPQNRCCYGRRSSNRCSYLAICLRVGPQPRAFAAKRRVSRLANARPLTDSTPESREF